MCRSLDAPVGDLDRAARPAVTRRRDVTHRRSGRSGRHGRARSRTGGAADRRRDVAAAVPLRARPRGRPQGPRRRPGRTDRRSPTSTRSGSPCRPRSATSASASSSRSARRGRCRRSSTSTAAAGSSATPAPTTARPRARRRRRTPPSCSSSTTAPPRRSTRSPSSRRYATARWITATAVAEGLDAARLAVAGDSVGGNMAAALTHPGQAARRRHVLHQSLYYPVTDAGPGHRQLPRVRRRPATSPPKSMAWFWDAYLPGPASGRRDHRLTAAGDPRRARRPARAFLIVDENDVLRDEGEAYARKLTEAGVPHHQRPLQRHDPRLHDAQPPPRAPRATTPPSSRPIHVLRAPSPAAEPCVSTSRRSRPGGSPRRSRPHRGTHRRRRPSLPTPSWKPRARTGMPA